MMRNFLTWLASWIFRSQRWRPKPDSLRLSDRWLEQQTRERVI